MGNIQMQFALATLDLILGGFIFFVCFCRVVVSSKKVLGRVRLKFIVLGPAALAFSLSPLWGNLPAYSDTGLMLAISVGLLSETYQWKDGPPDSVRCDTMPGGLYTNFTTSWLHVIKVKLVDPVKARFRPLLDKLRSPR